MNWFARKISRDQDIKQMREQENLGGVQDNSREVIHFMKASCEPF